LQRARFSAAFHSKLATQGVDNSLSLEKFKEDLVINVQSASDECVEVDIVGIDAPIANALRRILISEIPTMAIEKVNLYNNTSVFADEVLAHRLGLVPIQADARLFEYVDGSPCRLPLL
jgi:DNA-directed RNA polymerase I and III subunit RPAC1